MERTDDLFVFSVDLDGVVFDYETAFRNFVARERGVDPSTLPPQTAWSFVGSGWGFTDEQDYLDTHARAVSDGALFLTMPLLEGASEALWRLSDAGVHISVTTARLTKKGGHATAVSDTVRALDVHSIPFRDVTFNKRKNHVLAGLANADPSKVLHIDDSPGQLTELQAWGVPVLAMDQVYNRHIDAPRVHNWDEVVDVVLERAGLAPKAA